MLLLYRSLPITNEIESERESRKHMCASYKSLNRKVHLKYEALRQGEKESTNPTYAIVSHLMEQTLVNH